MTSIRKLIQIKNFAKTIYIDKSIVNYIIEIVDATRNPGKYKIQAENIIEFGASLWAFIYLATGAKATPCSMAEAEEITTDSMIEKIVNAIRVP